MVPAEATERRADELRGIMEEYEARLLRYATRLVNDANAAQDVVQDAFIKLHRTRRDGTGARDNLKGWLYRVVHNRAVDFIRKESRLKVLHEQHAEQADRAPAESVTGALEEADAMQAALASIRTLKPAEQQVVLLRLQQGLSYQEIAEVTNRSPGNVGCVLHHAVKKLAREMRRRGEAGP